MILFDDVLKWSVVDRVSPHLAALDLRTEFWRYAIKKSTKLRFELQEAQKRGDSREVQKTVLELRSHLREMKEDQYEPVRTFDAEQTLVFETFQTEYALAKRLLATVDAPVVPARKRPSKPLTTREKIIRQAIRLEFRGSAYARFLDDSGVAIPETWRKEDSPCPKSHAHAYNDPRWRERMHKEKSRIRKRMNS